VFEVSVSDSLSSGMNMSVSCSFASDNFPCSTVGHGSAIVSLLSCNDDMDIHLGSLGLRKRLENVVTERDLILNRAGHFDLEIKDTEAMTICPKHRRDLTVDWPGRKRSTCSYPTHIGQRKQLKQPRRVNISMSKEIFSLHGAVVPVGSGL